MSEGQSMTRGELTEEVFKHSERLADLAEKVEQLEKHHHRYGEGSQYRTDNPSPPEADKGSWICDECGKFATHEMHGGLDKDAKYVCRYCHKKAVTFHPDPPEDKLLPCPFCGKEAGLGDKKMMGVPFQAVVCGCGVRTAHYEGDKAISAWNRRAGTPEDKPYDNIELTNPDPDPHHEIDPPEDEVRFNDAFDDPPEGKYQCKCCECGEIFDDDNKRAVVCPRCTPQAPEDKPTPAKCVCNWIQYKAYEMEGDRKEKLLTVARWAESEYDRLKEEKAKVKKWNVEWIVKLRKAEAENERLKEDIKYWKRVASV